MHFLSFFLVHCLHIHFSLLLLPVYSVGSLFMADLITYSTVPPLPSIRSWLLASVCFARLRCYYDATGFIHIGFFSFFLFFNPNRTSIYDLVSDSFLPSYTHPHELFFWLLRPRSQRFTRWLSFFAASVNAIWPLGTALDGLSSLPISSLSKPLVEPHINQMVSH